MKQARVGLLVAAALVAMPFTALAQPRAAQPKAQAGKNPKDASKDKDKPAAAPAAGEAKEVNLEGADAPKDGATTPVGGDAATPGGEDAGLGDICKIDPTACPTIDMDKAANRDMHVQMYAVQQIYALRNHRFEVNPYFGITMNDQFVAHPGPGIAVNWYITNVLAIGVNGNFYAGLNSNSAFNLQTSRAARVGEPITEYQWNANANFSYIPAYGKFAGPGDFIFHYDFYVLGGVGAISTRPIAVVDPDNRTFTFKPKVSFHVGGGLRIFINRWLAATLEVSDYLFFDELENPRIADGKDSKGKPFAQDTSTWLDPGGASFTNNVQAQVGLSVFLPFSWEYRLPK
ncbi:MAG: outer membrane beta-barrel domain-containing protein [Byssovorax sp.]